MYGSGGSGASLAVIGRYLVLYALAATLIWVGGLKFAAYEAEGIAPLVMESPLLSWLYDIFDVPTFGRVLGTAEILAGIGIALRPVAPMLAAVGAAFAIVLFLVTVSFLLTTPGVYEAAGFPQLSVLPGQFLAKDLTFLAVSIWVLGDSLAAMGRGTRMPDRMAAA
ncbi:MAG: DUF417 family protein [Acidimicrobiia bacterium]|nr:DUF417 family protein [Acidimicrobiia bacterium]